VRKARRNYPPQKKVAILRRHLLDKVSVLRLCTQFQLQPTVFYRWLKQLFDNGSAALQRQLTAGDPPDVRQRRIDILLKQLGARQSREAEQKWMTSLTQGQFGVEEVRRTIGDTLSREDIGSLLTCICNEPLKYRNRAVAVLPLACRN
jgi:transposase